jgi:hypothetical protein
MGFRPEHLEKRGPFYLSVDLSFFGFRAASSANKLTVGPADFLG